MTHPADGEPEPLNAVPSDEDATQPEGHADLSYLNPVHDTPVLADATQSSAKDDSVDGDSGREVGSSGGGRRTGRKKKKKSKYGWLEVPILGAVAIIVAILVKSFLIQPFYIPSESMEKTLHGCFGCSGDRILVNKPIYHIRDPHPGDIVVFSAPAGWESEVPSTAPNNPVSKGVRWFGQLVGFVPPDEKDIVKRVIAIGGQSVRCCDSQGRVQVSDHGAAGPWRSLDEPYIFEPLKYLPGSQPGAPLPGDNATFGPITVPAGRLWVMGDHRSVSADSRYHCVSASPVDHICDATDTTIPVSGVIGKAVVIAWPPSRWSTLGTPSTFKHVATTALSGSAPTAGLLATLPLVLIRRRRRAGYRRTHDEVRRKERSGNTCSGNTTGG